MDDDGRKGKARAKVLVSQCLPGAAMQLLTMPVDNVPYFRDRRKLESLALFVIFTLQ